MISTSPEQTEQIANKMAKRLKGNENICLFGELGSGKTMFTKALGESLGIKKKSIKSPTFTIKREYTLTNQKAERLIHFDLYRLEELDDPTYENIQASWQNPNEITIIEWADRAANLLPAKRIEIHFKNLTSNKRKITITNI